MGPGIDSEQTSETLPVIEQHEATSLPPVGNQAMKGTFMLDSHLGFHLYYYYCV